jgi:ABC-type transporter Mla subunit MlaD
VTAAELALVVATVVLVLGFAALALVLARVLEALREVRAALADLTARTAPMVDELHRCLDDARADLARFDRVLGSAEAISANVEGASRVARVALSTPVIRTVALASGTSRAARRLRRTERSAG